MADPPHIPGLTFDAIRQRGAQFRLETGAGIVRHAVDFVFTPLREKNLPEQIFAEGVEVPAPEVTVVIRTVKEFGGEEYGIDGGVEERFLANA